MLARHVWRLGARRKPDTEGGASAGHWDLASMGAYPQRREPVSSAGLDDELAYRRHERSVLKMLSARYRPLDADARREIYQEAWTSVLSRRRSGAQIEQLGAYLHSAAANLASKRVHGADARRRVSFDPTSAAFTALADFEELPEDRVVAVDEARRLHMLVAELDPAEQAVLKLRIESGLEPSEVRERLGLTERQYRRVAERASKALLGEFQAFDRGDWARAKRSLLCACVMGIASARQRERAARLVADDPCCRAMMSELRRLGDQVAALLPVPAGTVAVGSDHVGLAQHAAELATSFKQRAAELAHRPRGGDPETGRQRFGDARRQASDLVVGVKQHATSAYVRMADPTPLSGARPGAVGALLASCAAIGGGVSYCANQQINPFTSLAGTNGTQSPKRKPGHKPKQAAESQPNSEPAAQAPAPSTTGAAPQPPPTPAPQPESPPTPPAQVAQPPAQPPAATSNSEFDPGAGPTQAPAAQPANSAPSTPAPSSTGEFSGP